MCFYVFMFLGLALSSLLIFCRLVAWISSCTGNDDDKDDDDGGGGGGGGG